MTGADVDKAKAWLSSHGREIDIALVEFERTREDGPVLTALAAYQNEDGGFGRALEPDVRLSESSVLATSVALQTLVRCSEQGARRLVTGAMKFIESTFDEHAAAWPIVPANVNDAAHAPWWEPRSAEDCFINPGAEILGYLYVWEESVGPIPRDEIVDRLMGKLLTAASLEMHDLLVYDRLIRARNFPIDRYHEAIDRFYDLAAAAISTDVTAWSDYGLTPLTVIDQPDHKLADQFRDALNENLAFLADTQNKDGSWQAPWSWFGNFPDEWERAEVDIKSLITREYIRLIERFDGFV